MSEPQLLRLIDHAIVAPTVTEDDVLAALDLVLRLGTASLVVPPVWLPVIAPRLRGSGVAAVTTCGFPLGVNTTAAKTVEAYDAVVAGADELDMVMNYSALRSGMASLVDADIRAVVGTCAHAAQRLEREPILVKVILETCYLTDAQKRRAVEIAVAAGRGLCEDLHRPRPGRGDAGGRGAAAGGRPAGDRGQGRRGHSHRRRLLPDGRRGSHSHRYERHGENRGGTGVDPYPPCPPP